MDRKGDWEGLTVIWDLNQFNSYASPFLRSAKYKFVSVLHAPSLKKESIILVKLAQKTCITQQKEQSLFKKNPSVTYYRTQARRDDV